MCEMLNEISRLRRPRLLVRAARYGMERSQSTDRGAPETRDRPQQKTQGERLTGLLQHEEQLEGLRRQGHSAYRPSQHIRVLSALMTEARLLQGAPPKHLLVD